jgi:hypothetical protein
MTRKDAASTRDQVVALHALYGQWAKHSIQEDCDPRSARLAWASGAIGRQLSSFSQLTGDEARQLIDRLKGSMGHAVIEKPNPWRRIRSRDRARAAGTAGRRDADPSLIQMASADDLARVDEAIRRLNWTRDRFEAWLRSSSSPVAFKGAAIILTVTEANKVWWALKAMLRRSGRWHAAPIRGCSASSVVVNHHSD